jgi:RecA-family ATPase
VPSVLDCAGERGGTVTAAYDIRMALLRNGYAPLPCGLDTKRPVIRGWPHIVVTPEHIDAWDHLRRSGNTGVRQPALDFDFDDPELCADLELETRYWLKGTGRVLVRFGSDPRRRRLIPLAVTEQLTKKSRWFRNLAGDLYGLELLGTQSQFIAYGRHPSGHDYQWLNDEGLCEVPASGLPEVSAEEAIRLFEHLCDVVARHGYVAVAKEVKLDDSNDDDPDAPFDADAALEAMVPTPANVEETQRRVILSLIQRGEHPEDVVERIVSATMAKATAAGVDWSEEVEFAEVRDRFLRQFETAAQDYHTSIPPWLPGEFHEGWQRVIDDGFVPMLCRNASGWFVRRKGRAADNHSSADNHFGNEAGQSKMETIRRLLLKGTTRDEVLKAVGWSRISLYNRCRRLGLKLVRYEEDGETKYKGVPNNSEPIRTPGEKQILKLRPFKAFDVTALPPRTWLYGKHYQRRTVSLTAGPGGMGKSSLDMVEAIAMATCRKLLGEQPDQQLKIWYHNGEDPLDEINRRIAAICQHYNVPQTDLESQLFVTSGNEFPLRVAKGYNDLRIDHDLVQQISVAIAENTIDLAIFDPLVTLHSVSEVDSGKMDSVIRLFASIGDENDAGIEIAHHVRKPSGGNSHDYDVHDIRGVAAITDAVRSARVLNRMSEKDAEAAGCSDNDRLFRFRVDRAKGNYSPPQAATWRQFVNVELANGDEVGVVAPWNFPGQGENTPEKVAADQKAEHVFLRLLDKFLARGTDVGANPGRNYAPARFAEEQEARLAKVGKTALKTAMNRLLDAGRIRAEPIGRRDRPGQHRLIPWQGTPE